MVVHFITHPEVIDPVAPVLDWRLSMVRIWRTCLAVARRVEK
jgi:hypothetical protein